MRYLAIYGFSVCHLFFFYLRYISESTAGKKGLQAKVDVVATTTLTCSPWQLNNYNFLLPAWLPPGNHDLQLVHPCTKYFTLSMYVIVSIGSNPNTDKSTMLLASFCKAMSSFVK